MTEGQRLGDVFGRVCATTYIGVRNCDAYSRALRRPRRAPGPRALGTRSQVDHLSSDLGVLTSEVWGSGPSEQHAHRRQQSMIADYIGYMARDPGVYAATSGMRAM